MAGVVRCGAVGYDMSRRCKVRQARLGPLLHGGVRFVPSRCGTVGHGSVWQAGSGATRHVSTWYVLVSYG